MIAAIYARLNIGSDRSGAPGQADRLCSLVQGPVVLPAHSFGLGNFLVASIWADDKMNMALKKPRWNHGLSHVSYVGHASPGDHHGIAQRLDAWPASGLCCVWSEEAQRRPCSRRSCYVLGKRTS